MKKRVSSYEILWKRNMAGFCLRYNCNWIEIPKQTRLLRNIFCVDTKMGGDEVNKQIRR